MDLALWTGLFFILGMLLVLFIIWQLSANEIYVGQLPPVVPTNLHGPYKITVNEGTCILIPSSQPIAEPPPAYNWSNLPSYKELYGTMV